MSDLNDIHDLVDDAKEEFPAKEDLKDRLVAIWVTGKHGVRQGTGAGSKPYPWYETVTLVLDDGPNWTGMKIVDEEQQEMLVPSVAENGPQRLDNFQHTTSGITQRLSARVQDVAGSTPKVNGAPVTGTPKSFKPMLGRINSRKNKQSGFNASWSISTPTEADYDIVRKHVDLISSINAEMEKAASVVDEGDEFDA